MTRLQSIRLERTIDAIFRGSGEIGVREKCSTTAVRRPIEGPRGSSRNLVVTDPMTNRVTMLATPVPLSLINEKESAKTKRWWPPP